MSEKKALVAMSGGVDSSVAALLMREHGYEPIGVTMMLHENDAGSVYGTHTCCTIDDIEDARVVASHLGIPFHVVNFIDGFKEKIIDKFIKTYLEGATPNPCIDCNRYMKFGKLFEMADEEGCEKVVTGHYATVEYDKEDKTSELLKDFYNSETKEESGRYKLRRGVDRTKDQTYVLYFLSQEQLSRLEFPLGKYEKTMVREIAMEHGLLVASKHDSQDICFVPDGDYAGFIERECPSVKNNLVVSDSAELAGVDYENIINEAPCGMFVGLDGTVYGPHKGYFHYTIGQRKGLGIAAAAPLYVVDIIPEKNLVLLGSNDDLFTREVHAVDFNLISLPEESKIIKKAEDSIIKKEIDEKEGLNDSKKDSTVGELTLRVTAKVRYRAVDTPGTLTVHPDGTATMIFDEPVRAVTPGQSLVIYDGEYCLGGGIIVRI